MEILYPSSDHSHPVTSDIILIFSPVKSDKLTELSLAYFNLSRRGYAVVSTQLSNSWVICCNPTILDSYSDYASLHVKIFGHITNVLRQCKILAILMADGYDSDDGINYLVNIAEQLGKRVLYLPETWCSLSYDSDSEDNS